MKKIFSIMLAVLMLFTFAACGDDDDSKSGLFGGLNGADQGINQDPIETNPTDVEDFASNYADADDSTYTPDYSYSNDNDDAKDYNSTSASAKVAAYVQANKADFLASMEESFAESSGLTCSSSMYAEGNGFVVNININELDNVDYNTKSQMQSAYDGLKSTFDTMLDAMQKEVPELEYFKIRVCEKDGDLLAVINAD